MSTSSNNNIKRHRPPTEIILPDQTLAQLVAQYLYESHLLDTLQTFVRESKLKDLSFGSLGQDPLRGDDVRQARWEHLVRHMQGELYTSELAFDVLEHIAWELGPANAQELILKSPILQAMKVAQPARFAALAKPPVNLLALRQVLADKIDNYSAASSAARMLPGRLAACVQDALRFKKLQLGNDALVQSNDVLGFYQPNSILATSMATNVFPTRQIGQTKLVKNVRGECAAFSPDGTTLALGSSDGFIELFTSKVSNPFCVVRSDKLGFFCTKGKISNNPLPAFFFAKRTRL